jgi:hypothetical protein
MEVKFIEIDTLKWKLNKVEWTKTKYNQELITKDLDEAYHNPFLGYSPNSNFLLKNQKYVFRLKKY